MPGSNKPIGRSATIRNQGIDASPVVRVRVASPLRSYTGGASVVEREGHTLEAVLADLDVRFPGIRFRIIDEQDRVRPHIRLFINAREAGQLDLAVQDRDEVHLICALSGG